MARPRQWMIDAAEARTGRPCAEAVGAGPKVSRAWSVLAYLLAVLAAPAIAGGGIVVSGITAGVLGPLLSGTMSSFIVARVDDTVVLLSVRWFGRQVRATATYPLPLPADAVERIGVRMFLWLGSRHLEIPLQDHDRVRAVVRS